MPAVQRSTGTGRSNAADLLAGMREAGDVTPLIGCSTSGEIARAGGFHNETLVVLAVG